MVAQLTNAAYKSLEAMTSQLEVTTFWGRLGSFGDKNPV